MKHLVIPELKQVLVAPSSSIHAERPPSPDLEEALDAVAGQVSQRLEQARQAIDDGMSTAGTKKLNITPARLGASVLRAMGNAIAKGAPLSGQELATHVVERLENTAVSGRALPRPDFATAYGDLFDEMWRHIGMKNLQNFPHADPGLGPNEQPPLVRDERENTWLGTARSVYSRYTFAADDPNVPGDADALARGEAHRACGRWGLLGEGPFVVMRSLYSGLNFVPLDSTDLHPGAGEFSRDWQDEKGPLRETVAVHSLGPTGSWVHGELAAYAQALLATYLSREGDGRYLKCVGRVDEAQADALKRAWMMCFEDDRREVEPHARRGRYIVRTAIYKGIPSGQTYRMQRLALWQDPTTKADDSARIIERREWTWDYIGSMGRERATRILTGDEDECRLYDEASQHRPMLPLKDVMTMGPPAPVVVERGAIEGDRDAH